MQSSLSNHTERLRSAKLKVTKARQELLDNLEKFSQPFTADDVYDSLMLNGGEVHRSTVYRDITAFARSGILNELSIHGRNGHYYELDDGSHHHHFICKECNIISSIFPEKVERALEEFAQELTHDGLEVEYHSLKFYGVCALCLTSRTNSVFKH